VLALSRLFLLQSYPYFSNTIYKIYKNRDPSEYELIVDSGAFSVFKSGKVIKLEEYHKFLDKVSDLAILTSIQLDVMGDEEKSWQNFLESIKLGYDVAPVFTRGTNIHEIEKMYNYSNIVFIGATRGVGGPNYVKYVLENNKNRNCHILGSFDIKMIKHYRPYSCDVSSWMAASRYGQINVYKGGGELKYLHRREFIRRPKREHLKMFYKLGFTEKEILLLGKQEAWVSSGKHSGEVNEKNVRGVAQFISTVAWVYLQHDVFKNLGTKCFMACSEGLKPELVFTAKDFLKRRGII